MTCFRRMGVLALALAALFFGCSEDEASQADFRIDIRTFSYLPDVLTIPVGSTVQWVNINPRDSVRTVTSGTGPADSSAGVLFDRTLRGYASGDPVGESFIYQFEERGTYPYFSRLPEGNEFTGRIEVQ